MAERCRYSRAWRRAGWATHSFGLLLSVLWAAPVGARGGRLGAVDPCLVHGHAARQRSGDLPRRRPRHARLHLQQRRACRTGQHTSAQMLHDQLKNICASLGQQRKVPRASNRDCLSSRFCMQFWYTNVAHARTHRWGGCCKCCHSAPAAPSPRCWHVLHWFRLARLLAQSLR